MTYADRVTGGGFRDRTMRANYAGAVKAWETKHPNLFYPDGTRCLGSSMAGAFWRGFDGTQIGAGFTDKASRNTLMYAYYKAGRHCAALQQAQAFAKAVSVGMTGKKRK